MKTLFLPFLVFAVIPLVTVAEDQIKTIIESARATIGSEAALDGLVTLRISGTIEPAEPNLPDARFLLIARKPCSQRLEVSAEDMVETTLLEKDAGCIIQSKPDATEEQSQLRMMTVEEVRRMAFNTRQLFNFYRADLVNDESVSYEGIEFRQGFRCHKLVYAYPDGVATTRYFSVENKKLVSMITDKGVESVEIGNQTINGIRFPGRIEYYQKDKRLHTMVLETIEVNKPLRGGIFTIPAVCKTK